MISTVFKTEFRVYWRFLSLGLLANLVMILTISGFGQQGIEAFIGATSMIFYLQLLVIGVQSGDQKRTQLYTRLPISLSEYFVGSWLFVLAWLSMQLCIWVFYGLALDPNFGLNRIDEVFGAALGIIIVVGFIAIGIDLFSFKPEFYRWLYLGLIFTMLFVAIHLNISFGVVHIDGEMRLFPYAIIDETMDQTYIGWILSVITVGILYSVDYLVYTHSENYLS